MIFNLDEILKINSHTQRNKHNETPSLSLEAAKLSLDMVDEQILEQPSVEVTPPKSSPLSTTKDCNKGKQDETYLSKIVKSHYVYNFNWI